MEEAGCGMSAYLRYSYIRMGGVSGEWIWGDLGGLACFSDADTGFPAGACLREGKGAGSETQSWR